MRRVAFCRKSFLDKKSIKQLLKQGRQLSPSKLLTVQMKIQTHNQLHDSDHSVKNDKLSKDSSNKSQSLRHPRGSHVSKKSFFKNTSIEVQQSGSLGKKDTGSGSEYDIYGRYSDQGSSGKSGFLGLGGKYEPSVLWVFRTFT